MSAQDNEDIFDSKKEALTLHRQALKLIGDPLLLLRQNFEGPAGNYEEALPLLEMAVSLDPQSHVFRVDLGDALRKLGKDDAALYHLNKGLALKPGLEMARLGVISLLCKTKKFEEALLFADEGTKLHPQSSSMWLTLGHCCIQTQRYERGLGACQNALAMMMIDERESPSQDEETLQRYKQAILDNIEEARKGIRLLAVMKRFSPAPPA